MALFQTQIHTTSKLEEGISRAFAIGQSYWMQSDMFAVVSLFFYLF